MPSVEGGQAPPARVTDDDVQEFVNLIVNSIEPESWASKNGRGTITAWRSRLVVRNSIHVHQLLAGALLDFTTR